jgi:hypothetical protein
MNPPTETTGLNKENLLKAKTVFRAKKLAISSIMLIIVGIFGVQFRTPGAAMMVGAVCLAVGLVFAIEGIRQYWMEKNAK